MQNSEVGIIFDLDNTLVQSKIDFRRMAHALVDHLGRRLGEERVPQDLVHRPIAAIVERARGLAPQSEIVAELWRLVAEHEAMGMQDLQVEPGAVETVNALKKRGHPLAVCTNNARVATLEALEHFGLPHPFAPVVTRDEVRHLKPSPEGLISIVSAWKERGIKRCVMVGDSWLDGKAAAEAGVLFVEYKSNEGRVPREPVPVWHRVTHLDKVLELDLKGA